MLFNAFGVNRKKKLEFQRTWNSLVSVVFKRFLGIDLPKTNVAAVNFKHRAQCGGRFVTRIFAIRKCQTRRRDSEFGDHRFTAPNAA
jgi:hypothetical protein